MIVVQRILITNDDGYQAVGIGTLHRVAQTLFPSAVIHVIAPNVGISGASRSLTFGQNRDGTRKLVHTQRFLLAHINGVHVDGTPADCVELAMRHFIRLDNRPNCDLVLSGVNHGWNLAQDIPLSGTFGAAAHAAEYFHVPAIALSAPKELFGKQWVDDWVKRILADVVGNASAWNRRGVLNINLPNRILDAELEQPWRVVAPGEYRAIGGLTDLGKGTFDLLEPMNALSKDPEEGDFACVTRGVASITCHFGAAVG